MTATPDPATRRRYEMCRRRCRTRSSVAVLDYLWWCSRRFGRATPSRAAIAGATGYCERTVSRAVAELEALGTLRVLRDSPHRRDDGTYTRARTNLYTLKWPPRTCSHRRDIPVTSKSPTGILEPTGTGSPPAVPVVPPSLFDVFGPPTHEMGPVPEHLCSKRGIAINPTAR